MTTATAEKTVRPEEPQGGVAKGGQRGKTADPGFTATLSAGAFSSAIAKAAGVVASRQVIPIADNALLEMADGRLDITTTNFDQALALSIPAEGNGAVTVPADRLRAALDRMDAAKPVTATLDGPAVRLSQGRLTYRLPSLPAADWPVTVRELPARHRVWSPDPAALAAALKTLEGTVYTGKDPGEARLTGIFFDFEDASPRLVATNRGSLGAMALPGDAPPWPPEGESADNPHGFILPRETARLLTDMAQGAADGGLTLTMGVNKLSAAIEGCTLHTRLVDAVYPAWRRVVPGALPARCTVDGAAFLAAIEAAAIVLSGAPEGSSSRYTAALLRAEIGETEIVFTNRNRLTGEEASSAVPCDLVAGEAAVIGFNGSQLAWAVRSLGGVDTVEMHFADGGRPVTLGALGRDDDGSVRVVAPVRI
jgi:DNA polymerase-3 subunit beta